MGLCSGFALLSGRVADKDGVDGLAAFADLATHTVSLQDTVATMADAAATVSALAQAAADLAELEYGLRDGGDGGERAVPMGEEAVSVPVPGLGTMLVPVLSAGLSGEEAFGVPTGVEPIELTKGDVLGENLYPYFSKTC